MVFWWGCLHIVWTGILLMMCFSHLHPHSPYKRQGQHRNKKLHHSLRHGSHIPCHLVRGTGLGAKIRAGWAHILKVTGMSSLMLQMRKLCPGNIVCVSLMQKDVSNLYWAFTKLSACIYVFVHHIIIIQNIIPYPWRDSSVWRLN